MNCQRCGRAADLNRNNLCRVCQSTLNGRRHAHRMEKTGTTLVGNRDPRNVREITMRREFSRAVRGLGKDEVPIARLKWLERPEP